MPPTPKSQPEPEPEVFYSDQCPGCDKGWKSTNHKLCRHCRGREKAAESARSIEEGAHSSSTAMSSGGDRG